MVTEEKDGRVFPAFILDKESSIIAAGLINDKGCRKSIEQNEAWLLDGNSGKLLPDRRIQGFRNIVQKDLYVEIHAESFEADASGYPRPESVGQTEKHPPVSVIDSTDAGTLLAELESLIYERKRSMPDSSYTTHLFEQGEEKIRKKTGEEAVELILARSNDELASETADLLYHIMVLFAERNMSFMDCLRILWERR